MFNHSGICDGRVAGGIEGKREEKEKWGKEEKEKKEKKAKNERKKGREVERNTTLVNEQNSSRTATATLRGRRHFQEEWEVEGEVR